MKQISVHPGFSLTSFSFCLEATLTNDYYQATFNITEAIIATIPVRYIPNNKYNYIFVFS